MEFTYHPHKDATRRSITVHGYIIMGIPQEVLVAVLDRICEIANAPRTMKEYLKPSELQELIEEPFGFLGIEVARA